MNILKSLGLVSYAGLVCEIRSNNDLDSTSEMISGFFESAGFEKEMKKDFGHNDNRINLIFKKNEGPKKQIVYMDLERKDMYLLYTANCDYQNSGFHFSKNHNDELISSLEDFLQTKLSATVVKRY